MNRENYTLLIPAAGRGTRSGLEYPKCLYILNEKPILITIIEKIIPYVVDVVLVINSQHQEIFRATLDKFKISKVKFFYQNDPKGMGDAILQAELAISTHNVVLIWSDIPLIQIQTIQSLIELFEKNEDDLSIASFVSEHCYTQIQRENGFVKSISEARALGLSDLGQGEREIGLFVFRCAEVMNILNLYSNDVSLYNPSNNEYGFLPIVEQMVCHSLQVNAYPIATYKDTLSFNSKLDLIEIEKN